MAFMEATPHSARPIAASAVHRRAIALAAFLFVLFVMAAGLYARYGYAVVLRVYEEQQLGRVAANEGTSKYLEFEDYLRVDPANLRVRGLYINTLIELQDAPRAIEVARAGLVAAEAAQRPIAMLLYARAQIASGSINDAAETYREVLAAVGESGEAHYGLAHVAAARGNFKRMRKEYDVFSTLLYRGIGTPDFVQDVKRAAGSSDDSWPRDVTKEPDHNRTCYYALSFERSAGIDVALEMLSTINDFSGVPLGAFFWRGVYEEEQGHRDAALDFYKRAADAGDALGAFAYRRLSHS